MYSDVPFILNYFHKHDTTTLIYGIIHVENTFMTMHCEMCDKYFKKRMRITEHTHKSNKLNFWYILGKPKLKHNPGFWINCNSFKESLRLSTLYTIRNQPIGTHYNQPKPILTYWNLLRPICQMWTYLEQLGPIRTYLN